jgi:outer membrane protein insertion porin family
MGSTVSKMDRNMAFGQANTDSAAIKATRLGQIGMALLGTTILAGVPQSAAERPAPKATAAKASEKPAVAATAAAPAKPTIAAQPVATAPAEPILSLTVEGAQRLEPDTVLSYIQLRPASPIARPPLTRR